MSCETGCGIENLTLSTQPLLESACCEPTTKKWKFGSAHWHYRCRPAFVEAGCPQPSSFQKRKHVEPEFDRALHALAMAERWHLLVSENRPSLEWDCAVWITTRSPKEKTARNWPKRGNSEEPIENEINFWKKNGKNPLQNAQNQKERNGTAIVILKKNTNGGICA